MALSLESARDLFRAGRFAEIGGQLGRPTELDRSPAELRALFAHALFHTGNVPLAERISLSENIQSAPLSIKAHCEHVLGLIRRRQGAIGTARGHFQTAILLA